MVKLGLPIGITMGLEMGVFALAAYFMGWIGAGMLRGLHDTRGPLMFALVGYWGVGLGIGSWLAFTADWKGVGIWVGLASGLAAVAALMLVRWMMRARLGLTTYRSTYTMSSRSVSA
jgi:Na+-driven multidrug efflux pump